MAFEFEVGSFSVGTTTGTKTITLDGSFTPTGIIFFRTNLTTNGDAAHAYLGVGYSGNSLTDEGSCFSSLEDAVATSNSRGGTSNANALLVTDADGGAHLVLNVTSLSAGQFECNVGTLATDAHNTRVIYVAIGGADSDAFVGEIKNNTAGEFDEVNVGFDPSFLMVQGQGNWSLGGNSTDTNHGIGWTDGAGRACISLNHADAQNPVDDYSRQDIDTVLRLLQYTSQTVIGTWDIVDFTATPNGFTINAIDGMDNRNCPYFVARAPNVKVGSFAGKTSTTGQQEITGIGFEGKGILLMSFNDPDQGLGIQDLVSFSFGAAQSSTRRSAVWAGSTFNVSPSEIDQSLDETKCLVMKTAGGGGTPTLAAAADFVGFGSDSFTLDWTTVDATARDIVYVVFGDTVAGGISVTPAHAGVVLAPPDPAVVLGSITVTPAHSPIVLAPQDPTVILGSITSTPSTAPVRVQPQDPAVALGSMATVPAHVPIIVAPADPGVIEGGLIMTPATATVVIAPIAPAVVLGSISVIAGSAQIRILPGDPSVVLESLSLVPAGAVIRVIPIAPIILTGTGIVIEGLEYTLLSDRLHFDWISGRLHFTLEDDRTHYTLPEEDD